MILYNKYEYKNFCILNCIFFLCSVWFHPINSSEGWEISTVLYNSDSEKQFKSLGTNESLRTKTENRFVNNELRLSTKFFILRMMWNLCTRKKRTAQLRRPGNFWWALATRCGNLCFDTSLNFFGTKPLYFHILQAYESFWSLLSSYWTAKVHGGHHEFLVKLCCTVSPCSLRVVWSTVLYRLWFLTVTFEESLLVLTGKPRFHL